jgi:hypothetical protein
MNKNQTKHPNGQLNEEWDRGLPAEPENDLVNILQLFDELANLLHFMAHDPVGAAISVGKLRQYTITQIEDLRRWGEAWKQEALHKHFTF